MTYTQPLLLIFLAVAVAGLLRLRVGKRSRLVFVGVLGLLFLSWPPVDWLLSQALEARYPVRPFPSAPAQAIVVLGSYVSPPVQSRPYALAGRDSYERSMFAAWLYKHWMSVPVLACGAGGSAQTVAGAMREIIRREGVPEEMIWTEERSQSTHENAVFGAQILHQRGIARIALVVDAQSMPRAEACFRKEGIVVIPAACEFRTFDRSLEEFIPSWKTIKRNEVTLHETLGLAWYWLHRWI
jgi:uncharacterized SAM-binding protein YcdF (DUF218 family)